MKIYMLAITEGKFMYPVGSGKIYKSKMAVSKAFEKYKKEKSGGTNAKILVADNWHEEDAE